MNTEQLEKRIRNLEKALLVLAGIITRDAAEESNYYIDLLMGDFDEARRSFQDPQPLASGLTFEHNNEETNNG